MEAGQRQLLGRRRAARVRPSVQQEHLVARLREVGGRDQRVVPRAGDDDIRGRRGRR